MFCLPSSDADSLLSPLSPRRKRHQVHGQRRHTTGETYVSAVLCKTCMSPRAARSSSDICVIKLSSTTENQRQRAVLALGTAPTLSLSLSPSTCFSSFWLPVWTLFLSADWEKARLLHRPLAVDEACYIECMQKAKQLTRWKQQRLEIRESAGRARHDEKGRKRREEGRKLVLQFGFFSVCLLFFLFPFSVKRVLRTNYQPLLHYSLPFAQH